MARRYIVREFKIDKNNDLILNDELDREALKTSCAIYIYYGLRHIYIGQTKNFLSRYKQHIVKDKGSFINGDFEKVIVIFGQLVTGDSLDDIERKLIIYMHADRENEKQVIIENRTMGNSSPNYPKEDEVNSELIKPLWENELYPKGYVLNRSLRSIENSILYKYSPFKDLSNEQEEILNKVTEHPTNTVVEGLAGTGKTVLLTNIAAKLANKYPSSEISVVVKNNWRKNAQNIFKSYGARNITVSTFNTICEHNKKYDFIIVDEAHRLTRYYTKGNHISKLFKNKGFRKNTQLDFIIKRSKSATILLYDPAQSIRPNDIPKDKFDQILKNNNFKHYSLNTEYRIKISHPTYNAKDFINGIQSFLQISNKSFDPNVFKDYLTSGDAAYFGIVDSIHELFDYTEKMRNYKPESINRVVAGYTKPWISKSKKGKAGNNYDWAEKNSNDPNNPYEWKWNDNVENWALRKTENQIGSIHAVQGIDLNYVGVIIGKDLTVNKDGKLVAIPEYYYDRYGKFKKNDPHPDKFNQFIKDIYYVLLTRGIDGIRVYFENKKLENYFKKFVGIIK